MTFGWVGTILLIDLTTGEISHLNTMSYAEKYIGGRGIAAKIAWDYIPPNTDAFSPENPLIAMTGPLTGTLAPTSGRIAFCSISPRVYPKPWYTHSTMGGFFGSELKYAGYDGIVILGRSDDPIYLWIHDDEVQTFSADDLWGLHVRDSICRLRKKHGRDVQAVCIGPAGENLVRYAVISHPPENASGHSGFGAVMGYKKLKAIVIKGSRGIKIANPGPFVETCEYAMSMSSTGMAHSMLREEYEYPIPASRPICSQSCSVCCSLGQVLFNVKTKLGKGKPIKAHQSFCIGTIWLSNTPQGGYRGGGIKVPSITGWKPDEGGAELHLLCDDLGIDLWCLLVFQPWFIRCVELGIEELEGLRLKPRNAEWFQKILYLIANREGIGDILAEDLRRGISKLTSKIPEEIIRLAETLEFAYGFPAHREGRIWDPEPLPFWLVSALMYASESRDPTICTHSSFLHLAEIFLEDKGTFLEKIKPVSAKLWGSEEAMFPSYEEKTKLTMWCQHRHIMLDCLPLCDFSFPRLLKPFKSREEWLNSKEILGDLDIEAKLLSECTGLEFKTEDLERAAERIFNLERVILVKKFGRTRETDEIVIPHFELPCNTDGTRISSTEFQNLLDKYYADRGWNLTTGAPLEKKIVDLGLVECL